MTELFHISDEERLFRLTKEARQGKLIKTKLFTTTFWWEQERRNLILKCEPLKRANTHLKCLYALIEDTDLMDDYREWRRKAQ